MNLPHGFQFAGVAAGIKPQRPDLALIYSATPCSAAGMFTVNAAKAAPVADAEARLPASGIHGVLVNSGNANALADGARAVTQTQAAVAAALGAPAGSIVSASTGIIGVKLPVPKILAAVPRLVAALGAEPETAADAMITTDTTRKLASRRVGNATIAALCKGSGMIAPQLATMITVLVTDALLSPEQLKQAIAGPTKATFERLVIDGDMSTNDCVLALANGLAGEVPLAQFEAAVADLFAELARAIAADGEGATKRIAVEVTNAPSEAIAADVARSVAGSTLVKAAVFGADPNWGRVLATVGARAGSQGYAIDPHAARVAIQHVTVYDAGPVELDRAQLRAKLREPEVVIEIDVRAGAARATAWGCDLSYDYVKINADYSSTIVETAGGGVARDDRFTNYSPKLKVAMLVQALGYISRFRGQRCVIACGELASESLVRALCEDVLLLRSVGLIPIVVASSDLVTLMNRSGGNAVGLAGKDGGILRAAGGELTAVDASLVELMLGKHYIPVIEPTALGEHGQAEALDVRVVAAGLAAALGAEKLIILDDSPGIFRDGELVSELDRADVTDPGLRRALDGGVKNVHLLDGRVPHSAIAELFTDSGVGTLIK